MKPSNRKPADAPRPEDFPIGSPESRAAARAMLDNKALSPDELAAQIVRILQQARSRPGSAVEALTPDEIVERSRRMRRLLALDST